MGAAEKVGGGRERVVGKRGYAELTRTINLIKKEREQLRQKRSNRTSDSEQKQKIRDVSRRDMLMSSAVLVDDMMPNRLLYATYSKHERGLKLESGYTFGKPSPILSFGAWPLTKTVLQELGQTWHAKQISFSPCLSRPAFVDDVWRRCECSHPHCQKNEDCRLSSSAFTNLADDAHLNVLAHVVQGLETLRLAYCPEITIDGLEAFFRLGTLRTLDLAGCIRIEQNWFAQLLAQSNSRLTWLSLNDWSTLNSDGIRAIINASINLNTLQLCRCAQLKDDDIRYVLDTCLQLKDIELAGIKQLRGDCFSNDTCEHTLDNDPTAGSEPMAMVKFRPKLQRLDLAECSAIRAPVLRWIAVSMPNLIDLRLNGCIQINDLGIRALSAGNDGKLRSLQLAGCSQICRDGGTALATLLERHQDSLKNIDLRRVSHLTASLIHTLFTSLHLEVLKLDHVLAVEDQSIGHSDRSATALAQYAQDLLEAISSASRKRSGSKTFMAVKDTRYGGRGTRRKAVLCVSMRLGLLRQPKLCRELSMLSLSYCPRMSTTALIWISLNAPNLRVLDLTHAGAGAAVTDATISVVARHCQSLEALYLARPTAQRGVSRHVISSVYLTDVALLHLGTHLHRLEKLDLSYHNYLTGSSLQGLANAWPLLTSLKIIGCDDIDHEGLAYFVTAAPNIIKLDASSCLGLNQAEYFQQVVKHRRNVLASPAGFGPVNGLAAMEARGAVRARLRMEDAAATSMYCMYRRSIFRERIRQREAAAIIIRAVRGYRKCRRDAFRQKFKLMVNYRRLMSRYAAQRIQCYYRKHRIQRHDKAARCIQTLCRTSKGQWLCALLDLAFGSATLIAAAWRGRRARIHYSIKHMQIKQRWDKEVLNRIDPATDAANDIQSRRALSDMKKHLKKLKDVVVRRQQYAKDIGDGILRIPSGEKWQFSLPISKKRQMPVYADSTEFKFDTNAHEIGAIHVFGCTLWPHKDPEATRLPMSDFEPNTMSYEQKLYKLEQLGISKNDGLPWKDYKKKESDSTSLLSSLAAARQAQARQEELVDQATVIAQKKRLEQAKELQDAMQKEMEEVERREFAAAAASAERHRAGTRIAAGMRGYMGRKAARIRRIDTENEKAAELIARPDRSARRIQKIVRGMSVRMFVNEHQISLASEQAQPKIHREESEQDEEKRVRLAKNAAVARAQKLKEYRYILAGRVSRDFKLRRLYERKAAIERRNILIEHCAENYKEQLDICYKRLKPLDTAHDKIVDASEANEAVAVALQAEVKAIDTVASLWDVDAAKVEDSDGKRSGILNALKGVTERRAHYKYVLDVIETSRWWGNEALRCHYRRTRAQELRTKDTSKRLAWLAEEVERVSKLREFVSNRRENVSETIENRYFIAWLEDQQARLVSQCISFDTEQEHLLERDILQMTSVLKSSGASMALTEELLSSLLADLKYDAERVGLNLERLHLDLESEEALSKLKAATQLKQKQEELHQTVHLEVRARLENLNKEETTRLERVIAFQGDEQGLPRDRIPLISATLSNPGKTRKLFNPEKWLDVYRSQPWLAQQELEEKRRREQRDMKQVKEANMAAIVEQRRKEIKEEEKKIEELELEFAEKEKILNSLSNTRDEKREAEAFLKLNEPKLQRQRDDYQRRLEKLHQQEESLNDFRQALDQENAEAMERMAKVKAAKAEFERCEGEQEQRQTMLNEARSKEIDMKLKELEAADADDSGNIEKLKTSLLEEQKRIQKEQAKLIERKERRQALAAAAQARAKAEEELEEKKRLQEKLRAEKKEESMLQANEKKIAKKKEEVRKAKERRRKAETEAVKRPNGTLAAMGLQDPTEKSKLPGLQMKQNVLRTLFGYESKDAAKQEKNQMLQSLMRRQRLKIGAVTAIRSIHFTAGQEETFQFSQRQTAFANQSLPHYIRLKKSIGNKAVVVWVEETADQDEFITDIELGPHQLYKNNKGWSRSSHYSMLPRTADDTGFAVWTRKRKNAVYVISSLQISYNSRDEEVLINDGYSRIDTSLEDFGFGKVYFWIKRVNRNIEPKFESEETIQKEMKQVRRELKLRPNDPGALQRANKLQLRLSKIKEDQEFRDKYRNDPLRYAIEFLGMTQWELERWIHYFEMIDKDRTGYILPQQLLDFLDVRQTQFILKVFQLLCRVDERGRLDFGETVKLIGSFCFFAQRELLHFTFSIFDADESGTMTHDEFITLLSDLHPENARGRITRALREIHLDSHHGTFNFEQFVDINERYSYLLHPAFALQHKIRQSFFGEKFWEAKLRKYMERNADIKAERALNTDKILAEERATIYRRQRRDELIEAKKAAAHNTTSMLKRAFIVAQIHSLELAKRHDKKLFGSHIGPSVSSTNE